MVRKSQIRLKVKQEIFLLLAILFLGAVYIRFTWIRIENEQSENLLQIARSLGATLPVSDLNALNVGADDIEKPQYQNLKKTLKAIIRVNPKARFAYIYTRQNGKLFIIADSESEDSKDYSPPGQEYTEADKAYYEPFKNGRDLMTSLVTDRWGKWRSVLIPFKDEATGKVVAIYGMDFNAKSSNNFILFEVIESGVLILIMFMAILFLFKIKVKNRSLNSEISDRKQAEDALLESENQKAAILRSIPDLLFVFNQNGEYLEVYTEDNSKLLVPRETLIGKNIGDFFSPVIATNAIAAFKQSLQSKEMVHFFYSTNFNNKVEFFEARIVPASENKVFTMVRNITQNKLVDEVLFDSQERARKQRNAIARIAEDEVISFGDVSDSYKRLTGEMVAAIGVERASIWLFSEDKKALRCIALFENQTKTHSSGVVLNAADYPRYFEAISHESRISADDAQNDPRTSEFTAGYLAPLGITSMLDAGIQVQGDLAGVVCLEHTAEKRTWYSDEESFASTIASIVAQLLANNKRKLTEEALRISEDKYRTIFENVQDVFYQTDLQGIILEISPSIKQLSAYDRNEIIGIPVSDLYSNPDDRYFLLNAILEKGELSDYEIKIKTKTGEIKNVSIHASLFLDSDGNPGHIGGTIRDITERKHTEEELEESREKYRGLCEAAFEAIFISEKGLCIEQNLTAEKMFGYSSEEAIGRYGTEWIVPEDRDMVMKNMLTGYEEPYEATALKKDGTTFPCILRGKMMHYKGKYVRVTSLTDITDLKQVEEALRLKEWAIESAINAIAISNLSGNLSYVNPAFLRLWGYADLAEVLAKSPESFWSMGKNISEIHAKLLENGSWSGEIVAQTRDGSLFDVQVEASTVLDAKGQPHSLLASFADVTERKKMITSLEVALAKAESGDRLKSAFMNNISHEVRTPLNGILGLSNLITLPDIDYDEKMEYYSYLEASTNRLLNTINNYVDISLIASGNIEVNPKLINLQNIFNQLFERFHSLCISKKIELVLEIPPENGHLMFHTDEELFLKIMSHLLDNAVKFTSNGEVTFGFVSTTSTTAAGSTSVTGLTSVAGSTKEPASELVEMEFFVKDTGIGINTESQTLIFESFMQEELSLKRGFEGSGLGLSIAQGFVQLLGGEMNVTSVKGEGSTFIFTIPDNKIQAGRNPDENVSNVPVISKPVILIAEDDESNLFYLQVLLKKKSVSILSAANGQEAVDICRKHPEISLVLMDINMPVMDGLQATREIKTFRKDLPIIACTAFALSGDTKMARDAGCDDYISKPVSREKLTDHLKKYGVLV